MNKLAYIFIGMVCTLVLSFSFIAFGEHITTNTSQIATGSFISIDSKNQEIELSEKEGTQKYALAKSVWVYRNDQKAAIDDLKPSDQAELIFNSKEQVSYIKAYSKEFATKNSIEQEDPANQKGQPNRVESPSQAISSTPISSSKSSASQSAPSSDLSKDPVNAKLDKLEIKIKGQRLEIEIEQERKHGKMKSEVEIEKEDEKIHLKGTKAEQFINQLLADIHFSPSMTKQEFSYS